MGLLFSIFIGIVSGLLVDSILSAVSQSKELPQFSQKHLIITVATLLWLLLYLQFGYGPAFWGYGFLVTGLLYVSIYDMRYKNISDPVVGGLIVLGLILGFFQFESVLSMVVGGFFGFIFFLIQYALSRGKWIGAGDIRMGVLVGVVAGWPLVLLSLAISYITAALVSLWLVTAKRATWKSELPFGPFLALGIFIILLYTDLLLAVVGRF